MLSTLLKSMARAVLPKTSRDFIRRLGYRCLAPWYWGRRVTCPLCGSRFRRFKTFVVDPTYHNLMCPWCQSLERHRLLLLFLRHRTEIFSRPLRLLHLAPEYCLYRAFRSAPHLAYLTAGLDTALIQVELDLVHTPFKDDLFEVIICCHVLEHIEDELAALRELRRVLKPGGLLFLSDLRRDMFAPVRWFMWLVTKPKEIRPGLLTSINAAYTPTEVKARLAESRFTDFTVSCNPMGLHVKADK